MCLARIRPWAPELRSGVPCELRERRPGLAESNIGMTSFVAGIAESLPPLVNHLQQSGANGRSLIFRHDASK